MTGGDTDFVKVYHREQNNTCIMTGTVYSVCKGENGTAVSSLVRGKIIGQRALKYCGFANYFSLYLDTVILAKSCCDTNPKRYAVYNAL